MAVFNSVNNAFAADYTGTNKVSKNLFIGGDLGKNPWQRGTSFSVSTNATYTADRFRIGKVSTAVVTVSKAADAPTVAQAGIHTTSSILVTVTTADTSIASGDVYLLSQYMEGQEFAKIAQRPFTISFWVKASKTGTYGVSCLNSGEDRSFTRAYTVNNANTWEFKSVTISASPSAGTWNYTNGMGLFCSWGLMAGSSFTTAPGVWTTGTKYAVTGQVNAMDTIGNTFQLALIQVEAGTSATPFEMQNEQYVLQQCQRYYYKSFPQGVAPVVNVNSAAGCITYISQVASTAANGALLRYPVKMRTSPTIVTYNPFATNATWRNITTGADSASPVNFSSSESGIFIGNPQLAGDLIGATMSIHLTAVAEL